MVYHARYVYLFPIWLVFVLSLRQIFQVDENFGDYYIFNFDECRALFKYKDVKGGC